MTTAFVLGGGGLLGAHEVGMLRALAEAGITPDLVVGTSIGAINGAFVAADPAASANRLGELWQSDAKHRPVRLAFRSPSSRCHAECSSRFKFVELVDRLVHWPAVCRSHSQDGALLLVFDDFGDRGLQGDRSERRREYSAHPRLRPRSPEWAAAMVRNLC